MFWYLLVCNFCERENLIYRRWLSVSWYMHQFTVVFLEQQSQNFLENSQKTLIFLIKNPTQMFSREFCSTFLNSKKNNKKKKKKKKTQNWLIFCCGNLRLSLQRHQLLFRLVWYTCLYVFSRSFLPFPFLLNRRPYSDTVLSNTF